MPRGFRISVAGSRTPEYERHFDTHHIRAAQTQAHQVKFMIRDRGSNYTAAFDAVLADAGIRTVLCSVRAPRMNAITERWIGDADATSWTAP